MLVVSRGHLQPMTGRRRLQCEHVVCSGECGNHINGMQAVHVRSVPALD